MSRIVSTRYALLTATGLFLAVSPAYAVASMAQPDMQNEMVSPPPVPAPEDATYASPTVKSLGTLHEMQPIPQTAPGMPPAMMAAPDSFGPHNIIPPGTAGMVSDQSLQAMHVGDVTYITGGVGDEERSQLDAIKNEYSLRVMSASKDGAFVGDTVIAIADRKGNQLLSVASGPLFFANLPDGNYTLKADTAGESKTQRFTIRKGHPALIHLGWK